jgi:hypothetical protein
MSWPTMPTSPQTTLHEAKKWLRGMSKKGAKCPCCTQLAKIYRRKLNSSMAYILLIIVREYRLNGGAFIHVPSMINRKGMEPAVAAAVRGDWAKLAFWGLIEEKKKDDDDTQKRTSGKWRPTGLGIAFVNDKATVPRYCNFYDGRALSFSDDEKTTIKDALGDKFDYVDLMRGSKQDGW